MPESNIFLLIAGVLFLLYSVFVITFGLTRWSYILTGKEKFTDHIIKKKDIKVIRFILFILSF